MIFYEKMKDNEHELQIPSFIRGPRELSNKDIEYIHSTFKKIPLRDRHFQYVYNNKEFRVFKYEEEYFIIRILKINCDYTSIDHYLCDQIDGVVECIKDKILI